MVSQDTGTFFGFQDGSRMVKMVADLLSFILTVKIQKVIKKLYLKAPTPGAS